MKELDKIKDWSLIKCSKIKPYGYIGYIFTVYDKDNTIIHEAYAKTAKAMQRKVIKYARNKKM
jgi:hypothetical protein